MKKKFAPDKTVGRLTKWLRLLGYDTCNLDLKRVKEDRFDYIILSRNTKLLDHLKSLYPKINQKNVYVLHGNTITEQIQELLKAGLIKKPKFPIHQIRCSKCNGLLRKIPKNQWLKIKDQIPEHVFQTHTEFKRCLDCAQIYWLGSHPNRMEKFLRNILEEEDNSQSEK